MPAALAPGDRPLDAGQADAPVKRLQLSALGAMLMPLLHRIRIGEGGLIGMATWASIWETGDPITAMWVFLLSGVLLAAVYLYNDVSDRVVDAYNPAKVAEHRAPLLRRPGTFFAVSLAVHAVACVATWWLLGSWAAVCAVALFVLNPVYSGVAKRIPGVDVVIVGLMGAAVVGLATAQPGLLVIAGTMTAISHAFQTRGDSTADRAAGIRSSATAPTVARELIWLLSCAVFAWTVLERLGPLWAVSALVPWMLLSRASDATRAWGWARLYFAVVWIAATVR